MTATRGARTREHAEAAARDEWVAAQLEKAGPLTQEQQAELRRVLLPAVPIAKPPPRRRTA